MQLNTFGIYARDRLDQWGREFALHRDCDYLGHQSKNMLQVLIEHKGEMPARSTGYKPLEVNQEALEIERLVSLIAETDIRMACSMRGYYCGSGRRKVERYETAINLIANALYVPGKAPPKLPNVRAYMDMVSRGSDQVEFFLRAQAEAA
jgi:hypothetical protein